MMGVIEEENDVCVCVCVCVCVSCRHKTNIIEGREQNRKEVESRMVVVDPLSSDWLR
jgi:hypothetical protein